MDGNRGENQANSGSQVAASMEYLESGVAGKLQQATVPKTIAVRMHSVVQVRSCFHTTSVRRTRELPDTRPTNNGLLVKVDWRVPAGQARTPTSTSSCIPLFFGDKPSRLQFHWSGRGYAGANRATSLQLAHNDDNQLLTAPVRPGLCRQNPEEGW